MSIWKFRNEMRWIPWPLRISYPKGPNDACSEISLQPVLTSVHIAFMSCGIPSHRKSSSEAPLDFLLGECRYVPRWNLYSLRSLGKKIRNNNMLFAVFAGRIVSHFFLLFQIISYSYVVIIKTNWENSFCWLDLFLLPQPSWAEMYSVSIQVQKWFFLFFWHCFWNDIIYYLCSNYCHA